MSKLPRSKVLKCLLAMALLCGCNSEGEREKYSSIAVFGDSLTNGDPKNGNYASHLSAMTGTPVAKYGRGGEPLIAAEGRFRGVLATKPGLIIVMEGTNDAAGGVSPARASASLERMVIAAKSSGVPIAICSIPPFTGNAAGINGAATALNEQIKAVAARQGVKFIDVYSYFKNPAGLYQRDGVHLSREGNIRVATAMANAL